MINLFKIAWALIVFLVVWLFALGAQAQTQTIRDLKIYRITPTLDTNAFASGDQVSTLQTLTAALNPSKLGTIDSITVVDKDNQRSGLTLLFFSESTTIASSENATLNITDALMATNYLGQCTILPTDYTALTSANSEATVQGERCDFVLKSTDLTTGPGNLYFQIRSDGAPTYTASGLVFIIGIQRG